MGIDFSVDGLGLDRRARENVGFCGVKGAGQRWTDALI